MQAARAAGVTAVLIGDAGARWGRCARGPRYPFPFRPCPGRTISCACDEGERLLEWTDCPAGVPRPAGMTDETATATVTTTRRIVAVANEKSQNVQDVFLNHVRKNKTPVTVFLVNGVKLQGIITWFDNFSVLLRRDGHTQLVYKHAISTVMPGAPIQLFDAAKSEVPARCAGRAGEGDEPLPLTATDGTPGASRARFGPWPDPGRHRAAVGPRRRPRARTHERANGDARLAPDFLATRPGSQSRRRGAAGGGCRPCRLDRPDRRAYRDPAAARPPPGHAARRGPGRDAGHAMAENRGRPSRSSMRRCRRCSSATWSAPGPAR